MLLLLLSLFALGLGPAIAALLGRRSTTAEFLDGLVLVALCGLVLLHILPHTVAVAGWIAIVMALTGFLMPFLVERYGHHRGASSHDILAPLVMASFGVHAFVDGASLVEHQGEVHEHLLGVAIVLHRLPDGLAIWSVLRPSRSRAVAIAVLCILAVCTVIGFATGSHVLEGASGTWIAILQAFVAGSVLHVILHRPHGPSHAAIDGHQGEHVAHVHQPHDHGAPTCSHEHGSACGHSHDHADIEPQPYGAAFASTAGAVVGIALLTIVTRSHPVVSRETGELGAGATFLALSLEAAPALLLAVLAASLVHAFLPDRARAWLSAGSPVTQAARGVALAPFLPSCSCGAAPLYRTLITKGTPVASATALLVAAPEVGFSAVLVSFTMLGLGMSLARCGCAIITAVVVALVMNHWAGISHELHRARLSSYPPRGSIRTRLVYGLNAGVADVLDHTGPWLLLGLALGAFFEPLTRGGALGYIPKTFQVPLFAIAGMPLHVCASGATPLVAVLMHKGLTSGAAIAFLVTGPASNVATLGVLARLHGRRVAALYLSAVTLVAVALGYAINLVFPQPHGPALHLLVEAEVTSWVNLASLVMVTALVVRSIARHGPRAWAQQLLSVFPREHGTPMGVRASRP